MDDVENVIRRIVAQADINVITKRLVRTEYRKLTGTGTLSADKKNAINAVLGKIIVEIAQKMQLEPPSNKTVTDNKRAQKDNPRTDNVITQSLGYQSEEMRTLNVCTTFTNERNEDSEVDTKMSHSQTKVVNGNLKQKSTEKSFVLTHPVCNNRALEPRQFCSKSSGSKCKLMTSSEALTCVLKSDDTRSDNSASEFFDSPQKKTTAGYRLLKEANVNDCPDRKTKQTSEKQIAMAFDFLNTGERLSSEITITPDKKYKTQDLDLSNACIVNNNHNRSPTNSSQSSGSHRNVHNFFKELYSKSDVSYTPENSCSKSSSLDFLTMNSQKCRQDCVIDSSSDNYDVHLVDVNLVTNLSDQEQCHDVKRKRKINDVSVSSSDSESCQESCFSVAKGKQRYRLDGSAQKQVAKRDILSIAEGLSSSSTEPSADVSFGSEVISTPHRDVNWDSDNFVPITQVESGTYHDSNDSSSPFVNMRRRARFKVKARKRIFDDSDSDFQLSGSPQKNTSNKPKRNGKHANVMIKIVDKYSQDVEVIKYGVISDSEMLESIENKAERTFSSQIRKEQKSFSGSKHFKAKKQPLKMLKSKTCNVYNCDLDSSLENVTCSQSHAQDSNQTSRPTKSVYDLSNDSDDEFNVPLSSLKSYRNYVSRGNAAVNYHGREVNKCSVIISAKEKEISDCVRNNSCSKSRNQLGPKPQDCLLNSVSSNILKSSQKIPFTLRQTTEYTMNDSSDSSRDSTSSHHSHCGEQVSSSEVRTPQISDSDNSLPRLSHISPVCNPQSTTTHSMTKKSCINVELAKLRMICRKVTLVLRNTIELAGCDSDTDKINRIKQLLKDRGMQGNPSFKKADQLNLWKEMKELECDKFTLNNQRAGRRGQHMNEGSFGDIDDSSREHQGTIHASSEDVFFDLKDVITIDDSDS